MVVNSDVKNQTQLQALEDVFAPLLAKAQAGSGLGAEEVNNSAKKPEETDTAKCRALRVNHDVANETQRILNEGIEKSPALFFKWFEHAAPLLMNGIVNNTSIEEFEAFEAEFMPKMQASYLSTFGETYSSQKMADVGMKEAPGLFTQWVGDALTLFMFDNAPLLQILNFQLRQSLSKAQVSMTKAQMENAEASKEMTIAKGRTEAQKCIDQAATSFVTGGLGLAQTGASFKDNFISQDTFQKDLANHDNMLELLNEGKNRKPDGPTATGTVQEPLDPVALLGDQEQARVLAKEYKDDYDAELARQMEGSPLAHEDGHKSWAGLNQDNALVSQKRILEARRKASSYAMDQLGKKLSDGSIDARFGDQLLHNPKVAGAFMDELFAHAGGSKGLDAMLSGKSTMTNLGGPEGPKCNVKDDLLRSFGKSDTKPYVRNEDGSIKMQPKMIKDGAGNSIQALDDRFQPAFEPVIDHGRPSTSEVFKADMERRRDTKAGRAQQEYAQIENNRLKRQMLSDALGGMTRGGLQIDEAEQTKIAAEHEAAARIDDVLASNFASAREALSGALSGAYERVQGFDSWFSGLQQQLAGAVSQSLA